MCRTRPHCCVCLYHADFPSSHGKARFTFSPEAHGQPNLPCYSQLSHHAFQQYQLGSITESLKSDSGLAAGGTSWDVENLAPPPGCYPGSPGHQGSSQMGRTEKRSDKKSPVCELTWPLQSSVPLLLSVARGEFNRGASEGGEVSTPTSGGVHKD